MKKPLFGLTLVLMVFLLHGCAAGPMYGDVSFDSNLYYSDLTYTFTNTSDFDILYETGDPVWDFLWLYDAYASNPNEDEKAIYEAFILSLKQVSITKNVSISTLFNLTSSDLKAHYDDLDLPFGINEVVTFNTITAQIEALKAEQITPSITKKAYVEYRLNITLSDADIAALNFLQSVYNEFKMYHSGFSIKDKTFETFQSLLDQTYSETDLDALEAAYTIIQSIHQQN